MKKKVQTSIKVIIVITVLTLINCGLLVLSFFLPTAPMRQHLAESYPLIEAEHPYFQWDQGYTSSMVDGWSEFTLYGVAINEDAKGTAFEKAMFMWFIDTEGLDRDKSVLRYARYPDEYFEQSMYPRYWNGIVIFMKILLLFFTIPDIRMLNMFLHMTLLISTIVLMVKNNMKRFLIPYITAILFINPITMIMSLTFSSEYIPMLLAIIVILLWGEKIECIEDGWNLFFAIVGSVTSFLCFLSSPGITLGIPLVVLIWWKREKNIVKTVISSSCYWVVAYGFTWALKWIVCTLFTSYNLLENAFHQMNMYENTSIPGNAGATVMERIIHNLWAYKTPAFMILFVMTIIIIIISLRFFLNEEKECTLRNSTSFEEVNANILDICIGYMLVAAIPFAIIIGLGNGYAYTHYFMAHRQFAITVLASLCLVRTFANKLLYNKIC